MVLNAQREREGSEEPLQSCMLLQEARPLPQTASLTLDLTLYPPGPILISPFLTRVVLACRPASASRRVTVCSRQQARTHVYHLPLGTQGSLTVRRECSLKDPLPRTKITIVPPVL